MRQEKVYSEGSLRGTHWARHLEAPRTRRSPTRRRTFLWNSTILACVLVMYAGRH